MSVHRGEEELLKLQRWLVEPNASFTFEDPLNRRLVDAWSQYRERGVGVIDVLVLLRQQIRRQEFHNGQDFITVAAESFQFDPSELARVGLVRDDREGSRANLFAKRWSPSWIQNPNDLDLDFAAAAGVSVGFRAREGRKLADRAFAQATLNEEYKSPGQCAAVRLALELPVGRGLLVNLPTGSGKTEVAMTMAWKASEAGRTTLMVVPTISLAQNLEGRLRSLWSRLRPGVDFSDYPFAWTSETSFEDRVRLKEALSVGGIPMVVTSPESLDGPLWQAVRDAAQNGQIDTLIIDEAHLVTQWGRSFRPAYRMLSKLWDDLNADGVDGSRLLLLSATYGGDVLDDLLKQFRCEGGLGVVAANALRAEPDFWIADVTEDREVREARVVEALEHLPRPAIVYVTKPKEANRLKKSLQRHGFDRLAIVSGETPAHERREVLEGLQTSSMTESKFDLVVATSAFGLGIDVDEVRTVIHACLPETTDRWYQEIGRAGRDEYASAAVLIPWKGDLDEAQGLGTSVLTLETAKQRWIALRDGSLHKGPITYTRLSSSPLTLKDGSYNRLWNAQVLEGMEMIGGIDFSRIEAWRARELFGEMSEDDGELAEAWFEVSLRSPEILRLGDAFEEAWSAWKSSIDAQTQQSLSAMEHLVEVKDVCASVKSAYTPTEDVQNELGDCSSRLTVSTPCGRCQWCQIHHETFALEDAPEAGIRWPHSSGETQFERNCREHEFRHYGGGVAEAVWVIEMGDMAPDQALKLLAAAGAKVGIGVESNEVFEYSDSLDYIVSLLPIPTVIILPDQLSLEWCLSVLSLRTRRADNSLFPIVVLVKSIPMELVVTPPLNIEDLEGILA